MTVNSYFSTTPDLRQVTAEIRALLAKDEVSFAEVLGVCLHYAADETFCNSLSQREYDRFMALTGRIVTIAMRRNRGQS